MEVARLLRNTNKQPENGSAFSFARHNSASESMPLRKSTASTATRIRISVLICSMDAATAQGAYCETPQTAAPPAPHPLHGLPIPVSCPPGLPPSTQTISQAQPQSRTLTGNSRCSGERINRELCNDPHKWHRKQIAA